MSAPPALLQALPPPDTRPWWRRWAARLRKPNAHVWLTLGLVALGMLLGQRLSENAGMAQLAAVASERLELYTAALEAELARHDYLPNLIAIDEEVQALIAQPQDTPLRRRADLKLARITVRAGASASYLVDAQRNMLASSQASNTGNNPLSAGEQARLRDALQAQAQHFFAVNEGNGSTEYFMLHLVRRQRQLQAAVVVRLNLAPLEATWVDLGLRSHGEKLLGVDDNDVLIMSSVPEWKYRILGHVTPEVRAALQASGRYPGADLQGMGVDTEGMEKQDALLVAVPAAKGLREGGLLLAQQRAAAPLGVRLVTLSDPAEVWRQAHYATWGGGAFGASVGLMSLYLASRRRALRQVFQAQTALQKAHGELERLVDHRTRELRATNEELKRQIAQTLQAETELVQAGKLAVLGQMSAGISHELNQPLTALRALSANTLRFLEAGRTQTVAENLKAIDSVVERMAAITRQLKSFARKAENAAEPAVLQTAIANVLLLLEHRLRAAQVEVRQDLTLPENLRVKADANRLEQVLVNLVGNAIDAMDEVSPRRLLISARLDGERVRVQVRDNGKGLDPALVPRLFEPFFTTKPAGQGLGLGLVISSKIVHEFGGTLRAVPPEDMPHAEAGGMCFEFDLAWE